MSLLLGESGLLSFGILAFWHDGQSPLVLAMRRGVRVILEGDRFEVSIGDIEGEGVSLSVTFYEGTRAGTYTTNLKVGIIVETNPVGVALGESGKGSCSVELCLELVYVVFAEFEKVVGTMDGGGVSRGRVMVIVDEATYDGQIISSLDS